MTAEIQIDYLILEGNDKTFYIHPALIGFIEDKLIRDPIVNDLKKKKNIKEANDEIIDRLFELLCENIKFNEKIFYNSSDEEILQIIELVLRSILLTVEKKYYNVRDQVASPKETYNT